ncbi:MAG: MMPL family transporter [Pseudomonadales bacterium]|nr:MMPL family transporter [Pseudomonadales bacterium]
MGNRIFSLYLNVVLKRPGIFTIILLALSAVVASNIVHFELDASADSLTLEDDEDLRYYREIRKHFPSSDDFLVVAYSPNQDLFSDKSLGILAALQQDLLTLESVTAVNSILNVPLLHDPDMELTTVSDYIVTLEDPGVDREEAKKELLSNPIYRDMLISRDAKTVAIQIVFDTDPEALRLVDRREELRDKRRLGRLTISEKNELSRVSLKAKDLNARKLEIHRDNVRAIREITAQYKENARIFLGGMPMIVVDMTEYVRNDLRVFGGGVVIFLVVILFVIFRRPRWVILPLFCSVVTCMVMTGYLGMVRFPVTVISSNFISLLLIITISMIIHLTVRYREIAKLNPDADQQQLVGDTLKAMIWPCLYTALTTMVAFFSLLVSGIRPVIDFGMMMSIGIAIAFFMAFTLFPSILLILQRSKGAMETGGDKKPLSLYFADFTKAYGNKLVLMCVAITLFCFVGISRLSVENRFIDYFKESTEIHQGMKEIDKQLGGTTPMDIIISGVVPVDLPDVVEEVSEANIIDDFSDEYEAEEADCFVDDECLEDVYADSTFFTVERVEGINRIHQYLDDLPETGKVLSVASTMQVTERIKGAPLSTLELAFMNSLFPEELRELLLDPYLNEETGQIRFTMRVMDSNPDLKRAEFIDTVRNHLVHELEVDEDKLRFTSMLVLYNNMLQSLFKSQIATLGVVFVGVMLMFWLLFQSLSIAFIAILPNLFAASFVLGMMGWIGIPLDMMTITIAAISVGIAVDNTIHYIYRFRVEFPKDRNYGAAMFRSHQSIGRAMYYTSVTIIVGFSILGFSNFNPTIYFGLFTSLAMFIALLGSLTLLPQLLIMFQPLGKNEQLKTVSF